MKNNFWLVFSAKLCSNNFVPATYQNELLAFMDVHLFLYLLMEKIYSYRMEEWLW
jgi:hypothetical protein